MRNETTLRGYLQRHGIPGEILEFDDPVRTVEAASVVAGVPPGQIVKSLVLVDEEGEAFVCLIRGDRRLDLGRAAEALGTERLRLANAEEVRRATGYRVGAVPPVGLRRRLRTLMDAEVEELDTMVAGGGSPRTLVRLSPRDVLQATQAEVFALTEATPSTG